MIFGVTQKYELRVSFKYKYLKYARILKAW